MWETITRTRALACDNEPLILNGKISDYEIKGTLGITARSCVRDVIEHKDYDLDVGLSQRRSEGAS